MGLVPRFVEKEKDWGLSSQEIQVMSRGLCIAALHDSSYAISAGELKPDLEIQLGFALKREETDQQISNQDEIKRLSRRMLFKKVAGIATMAVPFGAIAYLVYAGLNPEAQKEREEAAKKQAEEKRKQKEDFEKKHILGTVFSSRSSENWRIRHPSLEEDVDYIESSEKWSILTFWNNYWITFPNAQGRPTNTGIFISDYKRLDGSSIPQLSVRVGNDSDSDEAWLLRDQPGDGIDNRVVIFENIQPRTEIYAAIKKNKTQVPSFELKIMKKISTNPR